MNNFTNGPFCVNRSWTQIYQDLILRGEIGRIGVTAFAAYLVIKVHINQGTGRANISHSRIGKLIGIAERTAIRAVKKLEKAELIKVIRRHRNPNQYQIVERLVVRSQGDRETVGELHWPSMPDSMRNMRDVLRNFEQTGNLPEWVAFTQHLRITESETIYGLTSKA